MTSTVDKMTPELPRATIVNSPWLQLQSEVELRLHIRGTLGSPRRQTGADGTIPVKQTVSVLLDRVLHIFPVWAASASFLNS